MSLLRSLPWLAALGLTLSGCDLTKSEEKPSSHPSLSVGMAASAISHDMDPTLVTVKASSASGGLKLDPVILDAQGAEATSLFLADFSARPAAGDTAFSTGGWSIAVRSTTPVGAYSLRVELTDKDGGSVIRSVSFQVKADAVPASIELPQNYSMGKVDFTSATSPIGSVKFSPGPLHISWKVTDRLDANRTDWFKVSGPSTATSSPFGLGHFEVQALSAPDGEYFLELSFSQGTLEKVLVIPFDVSEALPMTQEGPFDLGAQSSAFPSFLQLGLPTPMNADQVKAHLGDTSMLPDLVFGTNAAGNLSLMSPLQAKAEGWNLAGWAVAPSTLIIDLGVALPASLAMVDDAMSGSYGDYDVETLEIESGHYYGVLTRSGARHIVKVESVEGTGKSGTASVTIYSEGMPVGE